MESTQKPKVFRLRKLPGDTDESQALVYLSIGLGSIPVESIRIFSLATSLSPWRPSKIATLMFDPLPDLLQQGHGKDEWHIRVNRLELPLILDIHFRGLTPLRDPTPDHSYDCISLSGLSSHPFGSWQPKKSDNTFMWIRDELPLDLPQLRPIIYGYETVLPGSRSFQTITDLASQLINQLASSVWTALSAKPIVFLAHSLGGIILKRAIVALANSDYDEDTIRITGGIFFGVPNFGMEQSSFRSIAKGNPNEPLVEELALDSDWLRGLDSEFDGISYLRKMKTIWGYETCTSPTLVANGNGQLSEGPHVVLVTRHSATRGLLESDENLTFPLNENHSNIVKFQPGHEDYSVVVGNLARICNIEPRNAITMKVDGNQPNKTIAGPIRLGAQGHIAFTTSEEPKVREYLFNKQDQEISKKLIKSLRVPERDRRLEDISLNFENTFDWVFNHPGCKFVDWLQHGRGAFWINGSPGSGKSTLMKYIFEDSRTRELLHDPRNSVDEVYAGFFFHYRGSLIQKSFDGLLRGILSQILEQKRKVCHIILPLFTHTTSVELLAESWTSARLEEALTLILNQQQFNLDIFLFLDALDEYQGRPEFIARFVESIIKRETASLTRVKICFSSRPWATFTTCFKDYPALTMQDFTKEDIRRYCLGAMDAEMSSNVSVPMEFLVPQVVDRSKGVFLWVKLVVGDLARAANLGSSKQELEDVLKNLPAELDEYYAEIVQRASISSRWTLFAMLKITSQALQPLNGRDLVGAAECSRSSHYKAALFKSKKLLLLKPMECDAYTSSQIKIHSQGLIELRSGIAELLHQTVEEFVSQPKFNALILDTEAKVTFENGHSFLMKWFILDHAFFERASRDVEERSKNGPFQDPKFESYYDAFYDEDYPDSKGISECFYATVMMAERHGKLAEDTTGRSMKQFIDSTPAKRYAQFPDIEISTSREFASWARLKLYFRETLQLEPDFVQNCNQDSKRSLIALALSIRNINEPRNVNKLSDFRYFEKDGLEIAQLLLNNGYKDPKAFDLLISCLAKDISSQELRNAVIGLAIRFIETGHDPNLPLATYKISDMRKKGVVFTCPALHVASPEIVPSLLVHGADVNSKDSEGKTPLERLCRSVSPHVRPQHYLFERINEYVRSVPDSYQIACMLVNGGANIPMMWNSSWSRLLRLFVERGYDLEPLRPQKVVSISARLTVKAKLALKSVVSRGPKRQVSE
ncbi:uncharacterized protein F4812DRAFT_467088 [Daldinia caldariorum]|uniref:uncharacterized protein n=1 Tax=Daldinia caldariorum TaxID=326644 RepID=UPI0020084BA5|nr:uncharacterized protein F4812DRAFT_467088 [Daldinia caldariorum]KAI1464509.1 hypothetical protein F4812DRAFT_467088 [Daldinia caldariorum]